MSISSPPGEDTFLSFYEGSNFKAYLWYDDSDDALRLQNYNELNGGDLSLNPYGGNVGIGTTTPTAMLDIVSSGAHHAGKSTLTVRDIDARGTLFLESETDQPTDFVFKNNGLKRWWLSSRNSVQDHNFVIYRGDENGSPLATLTIDRTSGNVGIGTSSPGYKLTVSTSEPTGTAVYGEAIDSGDYLNVGGDFRAAGIGGRGVYGEASHTGGSGTRWKNYGGYFVARGEKGRGVYGKATSKSAGIGVYGEAYGVSGAGVYGNAWGNNGKAICGWAGSTADETNYGGHFEAHGTYGRGIYAKGGPQGYAAEFCGNVIIKNRPGTATIMQLGEGLDYAEGFDVSDKAEIQPGSVLVIDSDNPGKLAISNKAYDSKVAGIVAGAKGQGSGVRLGADEFDYDVALAGRVYCNVDATDVEISPGDLLTTSDRPGYAMKVCDSEKSRGAILGKAMEPLEKGKKGQIMVLVTLQ